MKLMQNTLQTQIISLIREYIIHANNIRLSGLRELSESLKTTRGKVSKIPLVIKNNGFVTLLA